MRQKGRAARRRAREAGSPAKARPTPPTRATDVAKLAAQIPGAAEGGDAAGCFARQALDGAGCAKWGPEIKGRFGVAVDSPELLGFVMHWPWALFRRLQARWRIAAEAAALLERQRDERRKTFAGYMEAAAAVRRYFPAGGPAPGTAAYDHWHAAYEKWETDAEASIAYLRKVADPDPRGGVRRSGPDPDIALAYAAHAVSEWTKQHGLRGTAAWEATVKILLCHGFDLGRSVERIARDPRLLARIAAQLKDRVKKALKRGTIRLTREGTVPSP